MRRLQGVLYRKRYTLLKQYFTKLSDDRTNSKLKQYTIILKS